MMQAHATSTALAEIGDLAPLPEPVRRRVDWQPEHERRVPAGAGPTLPDSVRDDLALVQRLRAGDESAFTWLVDQYHGSLLRLARAHVADLETAEEVVQETWLGVLEGLDRFEGRSSLKTWIFRILTNRAKTRGVRESRHVSFSAAPTLNDDGDESAVDPAQFHARGPWTDYWATYPKPWDENTPEKLLLSQEAIASLEQAIQALPPNLRRVLILRDVEGLGSADVCGMLGVSEGNQRVLLHRARCRVRRALQDYLEGNQHLT